MKQVIQNFKSGELVVDDVPMPNLAEGMVLVENRFSLISAGTERGTVKVAKANLLGKAKQRPDLVAQVLQNVRKEGLKATLAKVQTKLDSLKALGYSTSGIVHASMDTDKYFKPGDRVACAGQDYASHAEVVAVPQNLVSKIPDNVSFEEASFTTLGAIALQGVRQADPQLGDNILVIGLGLLGQITGQILKANGCNVMGVDLSENLVNIAKELSTDYACLRNESDLSSIVDNFTKGYGFDTTIITAATQSNDPIELAAELAKKKGKIVVVGAVKLDVPRDPHFYRKELDLKMSCSYGPGRYDVNYEENGIDYPYAYVRWTEQRNMDTFLALISKKSIDIKPLITHTFDIQDAQNAYDIVLGKNKTFHIGILLKYGVGNEKFKSLINVKNQTVKDINVGFIGAGSFAQSYLVPNVKKWGASLDTVVTTQGITSINVAKKFGFNQSSANANDILENPDINTIFIATRHNTHAEFTKQALLANKNVFVEKPIAMDIDNLNEIADILEESKSKLMVGFNRRFAPIAQKIKQELHGAQEPLVINIRVNAGYIPNDHWTQNPTIGGGRIIGEMCHFIDLMQYFAEALPQKVYAQSISSSNQKNKNDDNINISISFDDGSIGNLTYVANGDKSLPKERIEVFSGGKAGVILDFRSGELFSGNKKRTIKLDGKGHYQEVITFLDVLNQGKEMPISFESIYSTTLTTFKILDSLYTGLPQSVSTLSKRKESF